LLFLYHYLANKDIDNHKGASLVLAIGSIRILTFPVSAASQSLYFRRK